MYTAYTKSYRKMCWVRREIFHVFFWFLFYFVILEKVFWMLSKLIERNLGPRQSPMVWEIPIAGWFFRDWLSGIMPELKNFFQSRSQWPSRFSIKIHCKHYFEILIHVTFALMLFSVSGVYLITVCIYPWVWYDKSWIF